MQLCGLPQLFSAKSGISRRMPQLSSQQVFQSVSQSNGLVELAVCHIDVAVAVALAAIARINRSRFETSTCCNQLAGTL